MHGVRLAGGMTIDQHHHLQHKTSRTHPKQHSCQDRVGGAIFPVLGDGAGQSDNDYDVGGEGVAAVAIEEK